MQPRDADHGIELVDRAIGADARIVFLAALVVAERGRAVVAGAGIDAIENDHQRPISQSVIMTMTSSAN